MRNMGLCEWNSQSGAIATFRNVLDFFWFPVPILKNRFHSRNRVQSSFEPPARSDTEINQRSNSHKSGRGGSRRISPSCHDRQCRVPLVQSSGRTLATTKNKPVGMALTVCMPCQEQQHG